MSQNSLLLKVLVEVCDDRFGARGRNRTDSGSCRRQIALSHNATEETGSGHHHDLLGNFPNLAQLSRGAQELNADAVHSTCRQDK